MAICGYNEKIGNGLKLLVEGMIDALEKKMEAGSASAVLQRELVELDTIIAILRTAPGEVLPEMFIGLNLLARALFSKVQQELLASDSNDLAGACQRVGDDFIGLLTQTELKHQELRSHDDGRISIAAQARALAQWALERSLSYAQTERGR
jgi:hypothetical protein